MSYLVGDATALIRTVVVGVLAYAALVTILRVSGKRTLSQLNAFDFIVTVALGSTLATILLSRDVALLQGILAFLVLVGMQLLITWSSVRSERVARLAKSEPIALVYRGKALREAMARERVLDTELRAAVRAHGTADPEDVDLVVLETDGTLTVVPRIPNDQRHAEAVRDLVPQESSTGELP